MPDSGAGSSCSERIYRVLLLAYPKEYRREYGPRMEQAFRDLRREALRRGGGLGLARLWVRVGRDLASSAAVERSEARERAMRDHGYRFVVGVVLAAAFLLAWMDLAVSVIEEPESLAWMAPIGFFAVPVVGAVIAYKETKTRGAAYRAAVGVALAVAFLLAWVNLAVGIIGSEDNPANLMYIGVLAVGILGAIVARFRPRGMVRALFATALAQALVPVIALIIWKPPVTSGVLGVLGVNAFFVALFVGSALLFRYAAREQPPADAGQEG